MGSKRSGRYIIKTSSEDKILFPKSGITKGELIDYYEEIAPIMLPYIKNRPLTMHRFPDGIGHEGFYQKDASDYFPDWIKRAPIEKKEGGITEYVVCQNAATLVYLANQGCITPHVWLSKVDKLDVPDRMIFDLDPTEDDFSAVKKGAQLLKELLDSLGLPSVVMTTGSRGLHVLVPLKRTTPFDVVREYALTIAQHLVVLHPEQFTVQLRKEKRESKLFIDYLRNASTATSVAPYAVRAKEGAPVATPLFWHELGRISTAQAYTIKNIFRRLGKQDDPWNGVMKSAVSLKKHPLALS